MAENRKGTKKVTEKRKNSAEILKREVCQKPEIYLSHRKLENLKTCAENRKLFLKTAETSKPESCFEKLRKTRKHLKDKRQVVETGKQKKKQQTRK